MEEKSSTSPLSRYKNEISTTDFIPKPKNAHRTCTNTNGDSHVIYENEAWRCDFAPPTCCENARKEKA